MSYAGGEVSLTANTLDERYEPTARVDSQDLATIALVVVLGYGITTQNLFILILSLAGLGVLYSVLNPQKHSAEPII